MFYFLNGGFSFTSLISDGITIFESIFGAITGNPLLIGMIGISLVVSLIFMVYSRFHR